MNEQRVKIGPLPYDVVEVKDLHAEDDETIKLHGEINYNQCVIRVDTAQSPYRQRVALWHEILHGILDLAGLKENEKVIRALGFGIVGVLRDNPWLAEAVEK